ncbi:MAG: peptide chain release factor N(5)-glutamine methyltransferase [Rhodobacteraceae bacterium]|nr:peptide chain release factor N(5)-glutamine methyltransferase [Paracoccaceae bacterium]
MMLRDALKAATAMLAKAGIEDPAGDSRKLAAHALGVPAHRIALMLDDPISPEADARLNASIADRAHHRPVSKITGRRAFWKHDFHLTDATLDPRPDTEVLVAEALRLPFVKMLDLGTGTGCILLSCLADMPMAHGTGTDISADALAVAATNAQALHLTHRVTLLQSDWFSAVDGRYDLIVSNPPYIAADEMPGLSPDVRNWDPPLALTPGGDGLDAYRRIAAGAGARLLSGGRLLLEIGPTQAPSVCALLEQAGLQLLVVLPDLDGRSRVISARKP